MAGKRPLSPKERQFVIEFVWGDDAGNAAASALKAGFGSDRSSSRRYACTLRRKPHIRAFLEAEEAEKERQFKAQWIRAAEEAFEIATADVGEMFDASGKLLPLQGGVKDGQGNPLRMPDRERRAIASFEVETRYEGRGEDAEEYTVTKVKLHPKQPSIEFNARLAGKLKDKVEVDLGPTLEQLVLEADRKLRAHAART